MTSNRFSQAGVISYHSPSYLFPLSKTISARVGLRPSDRGRHNGHSTGTDSGSEASCAPDLSLATRWQIAREYFARDLVVETRACGYNKGGLLVAWLNLPGFVPASQLVGLRRLDLEAERFRYLERRQNALLRLKIIDVDEDSNRLVFSERATDVEAGERARLLREIRAGQIRTGTVSNLTSFGAFVDLGGVEGLIHLSQLSWRRLQHPGDVVQAGDTVEALVLSVEEERERIELSRKQLVPDPWIEVEARYQPGQIVEGRVSSVAPFGVFLLLEPELEGLLHVSEFPEGVEPEPEAIFTPGDLLRARVIHVSEAERRLGLSLRAQA